MTIFVQPLWVYFYTKRRNVEIICWKRTYDLVFLLLSIRGEKWRGRNRVYLLVVLSDFAQHVYLTINPRAGVGYEMVDSQRGA